MSLKMISSQSLSLFSDNKEYGDYLKDLAKPKNFNFLFVDSQNGRIKQANRLTFFFIKFIDCFTGQARTSSSKLASAILKLINFGVDHQWMNKKRFEVIEKLSKKIILSQSQASQPDCQCEELDQTIVRLQKHLFAPNNDHKDLPERPQTVSNSITELSAKMTSLSGNTSAENDFLPPLKNPHQIALVGSQAAQKEDVAVKTSNVSINNKSNKNGLRANVIKGLGMVCLLGLVVYMIAKTSNFEVTGADLVDTSNPLDSTSIGKGATNVGEYKAGGPLVIPTSPQSQSIFSNMQGIESSQSILSCPTNEMTCNQDNLESSLNYLCTPGKHTIKSVVVGSRAAELNAVQTKMKTEIALKKFENALYQPGNIHLIPRECREAADEAANEIFSRYLDKYRHCGLNEKNAINWSNGDFRKGVTYIYTTENQWNTWTIQVVVETNGLLKDDKYLPPSVTAYHELMHAEETPLLASEKHGQDGVELLTSLTTTIQLDEVFKKCKKLDLSTEVDYQKTLKIDHISIPIGKVANCYRTLTQSFGSLVNAVLSSESINFIKTGICNI